NQSLFNNVGLGERNFQAKADEYESNCYNPSYTATDWINLTSSNQRIIGELKFNTSSNEAEIELNVTVPVNELPREAVATINITVE
ncbi:MAG: hypothetical protein JRI71_16865, partial [Deltaproteobacteria bacterium]|nr:hypothetical protein [Deltaproteobacteria bacterium]